QARGGFVQDEDVRVIQEDAAASQQLRLPGGQTCSAFQNRVQSRRQRSQPPPQTQVFNHPYDFSVGHVSLEEGQVISKAGPEELHLLGDQADPAAQRCQGLVAQVQRSDIV